MPRLLLALAAALAAQAPQGQPLPVWEIAGLAEPESAYFDPASGFVYISNVAGSPDGKDGQGWISKASRRGELLAARWVAGLNAPKGMRACAGRLYVADIDRLVVVDVVAAKVERRIPLPGAMMLNDVAVDQACNAYVSDTLGTRVYRVTPQGEAEVFASGVGLQSPNGLFLHGGRLCVAAWGLAAPDWSTKVPGRLLAVDLKSRKVSPLPGPLGHLDGLERVKDGWFVSDWVAGTVARVSDNGKPKVVLYGLLGSADLGYAPAGGGQPALLLVPRMKENRVSAYDPAGFPR